MPRYIDAEKIKYYKKSVCVGHGLNYEYTVTKKSDIDLIPTADVVPKSAVEQLKRNLEQCENGYRQEMHLLQCKLTDATSGAEKQKLEIWRLQGEVEQLRHKYELAVAEREANVRGFTKELQKAKVEVLREIEQTCRVCGAFGVRGYIIDDIANLKQKYTEGESNDNSR